MVQTQSLVFFVLLVRRILIFSSEDGIFMSITQLYISMVFSLIAFSVLSLNQILEAKENKARFVILSKIGNDQKANIDSSTNTFAFSYPNSRSLMNLPLNGICGYLSKYS